MSFVAIPGLIGPMLGPLLGGLIIAYFHWSVIFFVNIPIGLCGLYMVYRHLPNYREQRNYPLDIVGLVLFGAGVSLLSYVLEVFGETSLSRGEMAGLLVIYAALLGAYGLNTTRIAHPLLHLELVRIRTFRVSLSGNLFTRLGIGGIPFLLPLLYQVGLGFSPIQSGLLIMPQALAAMSLKLTMPHILKNFGYRKVLVTNTIIIGMLLLLFATIGVQTPIWVIVALAFLYGAYSSLQYTSMNTLVYADTTEEETSAANSIFSTVQQMAISFGVATAGLATAFFIPNHAQANPALMIEGLHKALLVLGAMTIVSTIVFTHLARRRRRGQPAQGRAAQRVTRRRIYSDMTA
jgi:MFS family permease